MRPLRFSASLAFVFVSLQCFFSASGIAWAQAAVSDTASDADKEAARTLFKEGYELQRTGSYEAALDRFRRSQEVYPAPTALLHIAECQAGLHRLVEAAESYRSLARVALPPGAPPAFVAAENQGAAELQQIEPRIPHVRVEAKPANVPRLLITVDNEPLNAALLGVDRPIDPGPHRFAAVAPGYDRVEVNVSFNEKEPTKAVLLQLKPALGGVSAGAVAAQALPPLPTAPSPPVVVPPPDQPPPPVAYAPPAPPYDLGLPAPRRPSRLGLFFGPRLGALVPEGGQDITNTISPGFSLGGEFDFRFARRLFAGVVLDHAFLGTASYLRNAAAALGVPTPSLATTNFDAVFGFVSSPDHFAVLLETGLGYRVVSSSAAGSSTLTSPELVLGAGFWIPIGQHVRLSPRVDATFGSLSGTDPTTGTSNSYGYAMFMFGIGGYYNVDFH